MATSSYSNSQGNCVDVYYNPQTGNVEVEDTKEGNNRQTLVFTRKEWGAFLLGARDGEFSLDKLEQRSR